MKILDEFVGGRERHASMCADRLIKLFNEQNAVLPQADVIKSACEHKHKTKIGFGISDSVCDNCGKRIEQTVL